ncbi:ABC transporter permease [Bifidobacterium biavatii]|uniref:ABC-2 type transporter n=1 Tax=Bifidobacterium biavatii DSM 23969 TaxID=1437608 RepID=A0A086Z660_9BIFI|nr:ABC transporter permease [Bifidobacterium biavatii]KFI42010.1 ABC-2 type transporter [Bifidobacterium biavatii DSM 23969]
MSIRTIFASVVDPNRGDRSHVNTDDSAWQGPFVTGWRITMRATPSLGSVPATLVQVLAAPAFTALFYLMLAHAGEHTAAGFGAAIDGTASAVNAMAVLIGTCCVESCTSVSATLATDRFEGTMPYVSLGRPSLRSWAGRIGAMFVITLCSGCAAMAALACCSGMVSFDARRWVAAVALMMLSILSCSGMGLLVAACSLMMDDALFLANFAGYALPLVGGAVAPLTVFPPIVAGALHAMPLAWLTDAARALAAGRWHAMMVDSLIGVGIGLLWAVAALAVWRICMAYHRRHDTVSSLGL